MTYDEFKEWFNSQELPMAPTTLTEYIKANDIKFAGSYYSILLALDDALIRIDVGEKDPQGHFLSRVLQGIRGKEDEIEPTDGVPCLKYISRYEDDMLEIFLKVLEQGAIQMDQDLINLYAEYNLMLNYHYRKQREKKAEGQIEKETCDAN